MIAVLVFVGGDLMEITLGWPGLVISVFVFFLGVLLDDDGTNTILGSVYLSFYLFVFFMYHFGGVVL